MIDMVGVTKNVLVFKSKNYIYGDLSSIYTIFLVPFVNVAPLRLTMMLKSHSNLAILSFYLYITSKVYIFVGIALHTCCCNTWLYGPISQ